METMETMSAETTARVCDPEHANEAVESAKSDFIELLEGRAAFYRMLAALFWEPLDQQSIDTMAQSDWAEFSEISEACAMGANDMRRYLRKRNSGTRRELACDFTSVFGGTHSYQGRYATPYKSLFTSEDGSFYAESYREVYRAFKQERVRLEGKDYPEDHLSFLCEFMALESVRIAQAVQQGDVKRATAYVRASRDFLEEHIVSWYGDFRDLALLLIETRFYRGAVKMAGGWFERDLQQLDDMLELDIAQLAA